MSCGGGCGKHQRVFGWTLAGLGQSLGLELDDAVAVLLRSFYQWA
jgi:hypothetical protein